MRSCHVMAARRKNAQFNSCHCCVCLLMLILSLCVPWASKGYAMAGEPILIVDDNPVNLKLARLLLAVEGYDVRAATDAEEALQILQTFVPCLILMDLQLPGMDGLTLTRRLKADPALQHIQILALTAYAMKGDKEKVLDAGCDGYLSKPIDTRALPGIIAHHLGNRPTHERAHEFDSQGSDDPGRGR